MRSGANDLSERDTKQATTLMPAARSTAQPAAAAGKDRQAASSYSANGNAAVSTDWSKF